MKHGRRRGFTLIELMMAAVIVAILAAVAIPLMMRNRQRAMITEAEAGLGTMRSALRVMYAQTQAYNETQNGDALAAGAAATAIPGIQEGNLDGRYFDDDAYSISAIDADSFTLIASGDNSNAAEADEVAGITITLDDAGDIVREGI